MKRSEFRSIVREIMGEVLEELVNEDTTLRSLVVKAPNEAKAQEAVQHLKANGIEARSAYPAKFGLASGTEKEGWGVFVEPSQVKAAAKSLQKISKGLSFDPYVHA